MQYRTIGIFAHIDSGKTTLTEQILFQAGLVPSPGNIEDGTTESDTLPEEIARGISIQSSFFEIPWEFQGSAFRIQILDTPGHLDFSDQVAKALPFTQIAIVLLEAGTRVQSQARLIIEQLIKDKIPVIFFINKLDKLGLEFLDALIDLETILGKAPVILFETKNLGFSYFLENPNDFQNKEIEEQLLWNSDLIDLALSESIPMAIREGLRTGPKAGTVFPVYGGSAKKGFGTRDLLDLVCFLEPRSLPVFPSPMPIYRRLDPEGKRFFIFSWNQSVSDFRTSRASLGKIDPLQVFSPFTGEPLFSLEANQWFGVWENGVLDPDLLGTLKQNTNNSSFYIVLEPEFESERSFWLERLEKLHWEDPSYRYQKEEETGQIVLVGNGELHLEIGWERLTRNSEKKLSKSSIRVARFEILEKMSKKVAFEHRAFGGESSSGALTAVLEDTAGFSKHIAFEVSLPEEWKVSIESAFWEATLRGPLGLEILGIRMRVIAYEPPEFPSEHVVSLLKVAILAGFKEFLMDRTRRIGPVTDLEILSDQEHLGSILSELSRRSVKVLSVEPEGRNKSRVTAKAPSENLLGFSGVLRNMTKGIGISWERSTFTFDAFAVI